MLIVCMPKYVQPSANGPGTPHTPPSTAHTHTQHTAHRSGASPQRAPNEARHVPCACVRVLEPGAGHVPSNHRRSRPLATWDSHQAQAHRRHDGLGGPLAIATWAEAPAQRPAQSHQPSTTRVYDDYARISQSSQTALPRLAATWIPSRPIAGMRRLRIAGV